MNTVKPKKPVAASDKQQLQMDPAAPALSKSKAGPEPAIPDSSNKPAARLNGSRDCSASSAAMGELDRVLVQIRQRPGVVSPAIWLTSQPVSIRTKWLATLTEAEVDLLEHVWGFWARTEQWAPPGDWRFWLLRGGRGAGKTRAGAEWVRAAVEAGHARHIALIGPTEGAVRRVMVEGESGLLAIAPSWDRPRYEPRRHRLSWANGAVATLFSADAPERLRGPQHDAFWADELCAWRYAPYAWDMLLLGLRLGTNPRGVITTTPKIMPLYKQLLSDPTVAVTVSSTFQNAPNLAPAFFADIITRYAGTRLGRQELEAELVEDVQGALWRREWIERARVLKAPLLVRIVVAVDPAVTSGPHAHETGIIVAGRDDEGHAYILDDRSLSGTPDTWARRAVTAYRDYRADRLVAEANQGGELVSHTLKMVDQEVPVRLLHATRGKRTRAEPVAALYEQGRVHHVGAFPTLEDQLCLWDAQSGEISPDRLDALVWALTELIVDAPKAVDISHWG